MSSWIRRICGASALAAAAFVAVPLACSVTPTDEQVGKLWQRCFPGDFCDEGLTCVVTSVDNNDTGVNLGTDGGRCVILAESGTFESAVADVAAE